MTAIIINHSLGVLYFCSVGEGIVRNEVDFALTEPVKA
jgi:hypothetical protein